MPKETPYGRLVVTPELSQCLTLLHHLVQYGDQLLVVADRPGAGKTRLLELLVSQASARWRIARLCAADASDREELLNAILERFALSRSGGSSKARLNALESGLKRIDARGQIALVIVDDAHALTHEALRLVVDLAHRRYELGACFLLLGHPPLLSKLHDLTVKGVSVDSIYTLDVPRLSETAPTNDAHRLTGRRSESRENRLRSHVIQTLAGHAEAIPRKLYALVRKTGSTEGQRRGWIPRADLVARSSTWLVISSLAMSLVGLSVLLFTGEAPSPAGAEQTGSPPTDLAVFVDTADVRMSPPEATVSAPSMTSVEANNQESLPTTIDPSSGGSHTPRSDSGAGDENRMSADEPVAIAEIKPAKQPRDELGHDVRHISMIRNTSAPATSDAQERRARTERLQSFPQIVATGPLMMLEARNGPSRREAMVEPLVGELPDVVAEHNEPYRGRLGAEELAEMDVGRVLPKGRDRLPEADERLIAEQTAEIKKTLQEEMIAGELNVEVTEGAIIIQIRDKAFPSGSAEVTEHFTPVIEKISDVLVKIPGDIVIAGHTDDFAISTDQFRSNWELSVARSVTVLHHLLRANGFEPSRFLVQGHGDSKPLVSNDTSENRALNRRVEVILVPEWAATTSAHVDSRIEKQG